MLKVEEIRKDFPMLNGVTNDGMPLVYLDNGATTMKPQCVVDEVVNYYQNMTANAHRGDYELSLKVDEAYDHVREIVADFINCQPKEVVFTYGTTSSLNYVAYGYGKTHLKAGDEILISVAEHASNTLPWYRVAEETGAIVKFIPLDDEGRITIENVEKMMNDKVKIISLAHVGNVLGYIAPMKEICQIAHRYGAKVVVDGAQSVPHIKTDVKDLDCDFLAFSAHKMCGPTGAGVLYGKYELLQQTDPAFLGGGSNARFDVDFNLMLKNAPYKFEAGTPNIEVVLGMGKAIEYISAIGLDKIAEHEKQLHDYAIEKLSQLENVIIYNPNGDTGIIAMNVKDRGKVIFAQDVASYLSTKGVCLRSGNHCAKNLWNYLGTDQTLRCAIYFYNTKEEIDKMVEGLKTATLANCIDIVL